MADRREAEFLKYRQYEDYLRSDVSASRSGRPFSARRQSTRRPVSGSTWSEPATYASGGHEWVSSPFASSSQSPPHSARRPASAPAGGRRPPREETSRRKECSHLSEKFYGWNPPYGSIYANREPFPGPGHYHVEASGDETLRRGPCCPRAPRTTGRWFQREEGPTRGHAAKPPGVGWSTRLAPQDAVPGKRPPTIGFSFSRSRRM
mmetsp:Transcript_110180/g.310724  ORF Transcript_110180/g.310724 Transcript_110180/m.310724 type:complete len:206 (-) Transcript_110180:54-671(-)